MNLALKESWNNMKNYNSELIAEYETKLAAILFRIDGVFIPSEADALEDEYRRLKNILNMLKGGK